MPSTSLPATPIAVSYPRMQLGRQRGRHRGAFGETRQVNNQKEQAQEVETKQGLGGPQMNYAEYTLLNANNQLPN